MHPALSVLLSLLLGVCTGSCSRAPQGPPPVAPASQATVILISFDGWRWDYAGLTATPHLDRLIARGARAGRLVPVFPAKTFPNHYSLVTGLHPGAHGVVSNNMYDPGTGERFSLGNRAAVEDGRWWGGEPLWVTAAREGLITAAMFWPGSEAEIDGIRPTYWHAYDGRVSGPARVQQVLEWLDRPEEERPVLLTLYFSDADSAGHQYGPGSPEVIAAIQRLDGWLGLLLDGLEARGLTDEVNVVVTSDHGMAATDPDAIILLDDYLDLSDVQVIDWSPLLGIWPQRTSADAVYDALRGRHPRLQVYRRDEMPARFHYRDHARIPPVLGLADEGWTITTRSRLRAQRADWNYGEHGYDNQLDSMHGLFVAAGPAFAQGVEIPRLEMTDVHPLLAGILGLRLPGSAPAGASWRPLLADAAVTVR